MFNRLVILCCLFMAFGFAHENALGQPARLDFSRVDINTPEGPNSQNISALHRDSEGFLWVGTQNGLKRHDGIRSVSLASLVTNDSLITDDIIEAIEAFPSRHQLWIATQRDGIYIYNAREHALEKLTGIPALDSSSVTALYLSRDSSMWIGTVDAGLIRYQGPDIPAEYYLTGATGSPEKQHLITSIIEPPGILGRLLVGTRSGFFVVDTRTEWGVGESEQNEVMVALQEYGIIGFAGVDGKLWGVTDAGLLFCFDVATFQIVDEVDLKEISDIERVFSLHASTVYKHTLWIGTQGHGLVAYDMRSRQLVQHGAEKDNPASLSHPDVIALHEDRDGVLWVGSFEGLNRTKLSTTQFEPHYVRFDSQAPCEEQPFISVVSFLQSRFEDEAVWVGTLHAGLHRYDIAQDRYSSVWGCEGESVFSMYEDLAGRFWLGTGHAALYLFDPARGTLKAFPTLSGPGYNTYQILELKQYPGYLWLATSSQGLIVFGVEEGKVVKHLHKEGTGDAYFPSDQLWKIMEDPHDAAALWIATHDAGLFRLNVETDELISYNTKTYPCLPSDRIVSMLANPDSSLWLGTFNAGFSRFDWQTGQCTVYSELDGLAGHDAGAIKADSHGRLWVTTSTGGVSLFNPALESFTNFSEEDGLQSDNFYYPASYQNEQGEIFIGGQKGFNYFLPDSIQLSLSNAPIRITDMAVLGESRLIYSHNEPSPIALSHKENDITFQFAALDLTRPDVNQYRVKLEPIDKEWQWAEQGVSPRYATLEPGEYVFKVMGSNSDGVWNQEAAMVAFNIIPPIWGRWWFFPALSLVALAFVVGAFQYRIYHMNLEKNARSQIARDLHDDMGSKLGSLALQIEMTGLELEAEHRLKKHLSELAEAERALVNDLRLIVWLVNFKFDSVPKLIDRMEQEAGQMLRGRRLLFKKSDFIPDVPLDMSRRKHLFLFFKEALHNIVRHSEAKYVTINVSVDTNVVHLVIKDDGVGFDPERVRTSQGLISMQVRADAIQGTLNIHSKPDEGTQITLDAPLVARQNWIHVFTRLWKKAFVHTFDRSLFKHLFHRSK